MLILLRKTHQECFVDELPSFTIVDPVDITTILPKARFDRARVESWKPHIKVLVQMLYVEFNIKTIVLLTISFPAPAKLRLDLKSMVESKDIIIIFGLSTFLVHLVFSITR